MYILYDNWWPENATGGHLIPKPCYKVVDNKLIPLPNLAWTEGWADFLPLAVQGDPYFTRVSPGTGGYNYNLETATWGTPGWHDGDIVEGRVAGALYDIFDNTDDGFDIFHLGFDNIWDTISSQRDNNYWEFYNAWVSRGHDNLTFLATAYQNTIIYGYPSLTYALDLIGPAWNMVSFPVASENDTPDNIFSGHNYSIWKWDPIKGGYVKPPSDQPVELGVGYWINIDEDTTVTTSGIPVENYSIDLVGPAWNMIGFPVTSNNTTPENLFENHTYSIWEWNPITGGYVKVPDDEPVELGVGYWLHIDENMTVAVPLLGL